MCWLLDTDSDSARNCTNGVNASTTVACLKADELSLARDYLMRLMKKIAYCGQISRSKPEIEAAHKRRLAVEHEKQLLRDVEERPSDTVLDDSVVASAMTLARTESDPRVTNLSHFYVELNFDKVESSHFTLVRKVSGGINGDIFRYRWCREEQQQSQDVAVKKLRNSSLQRELGIQTNERSIQLEPGKNAPPEEDALTEIGVLSYLASQPDCSTHLLKMLGCFSDLSCTWLVTEFADAGELFNMVSSPLLTDDKKKRYSWELLQAVACLHHHRIGHRDISLENILIKDDMVKLMDFGLAVCSHSASGSPLRYFRAAGKSFYRAPECYVPSLAQVQIVTPCNCQPGDVVMVNADNGCLCEVRLPPKSNPGSRCKADVWGYAAQPADIFATGLAICILWCGFPLWKKALLADATFAFVHRLKDNGIASLLQRWKKPLPPTDVLNLLVGMLQTDAPSKRLSAAECLDSHWFSSLRTRGA
mmetsp:Transcript_53626/g.85258  ORF Transcript_53626/g.85258 Transcript_53626/m.85258 type:complete len:477 (-) Transcript_53626:192-1622(-)